MNCELNTKHNYKIWLFIFLNLKVPLFVSSQMTKYINLTKKLTKTMTFIIILTIIVAILLILVVLLQNSKGGGLTSQFSGASQLIGARQTTDLLEKVTWGLIMVLFVVSLSSAMWSSTASNAGVSDDDIKINVPATKAPANKPAEPAKK